MNTQQISMKNRKGLILRGIATLPDGAGPFPTLVNLHGFAGSKSGYKSLHVSMARELAKSGIACVRFDFSYNGESDGEFEDMTFTSLLEDTEDMFQWTKAQPFADVSSLILSGQSMGGFIAASSAPGLNPRMLVLMCPGAGMWHGCRERSEALEQQGILYGDIEGLKFSHAFNYDLASYHPFEDARGYRGPVLILRGTKDPLVDDKVCETYLALYESSSRFVHIENGDHNFSSIPAREALNHEICNFIKEYLKI